MHYLCRTSTYMDIFNLLVAMPKLRSFPVVDDSGKKAVGSGEWWEVFGRKGSVRISLNFIPFFSASMMLLGSIPRRTLVEFLKFFRLLLLTQIYSHFSANKLVTRVGRPRPNDAFVKRLKQSIDILGRHKPSCFTPH